MDITILKDSNINETRVPLTPWGVAYLVKDNHRVYIETGAGEESFYSDSEYKEAGAKIVYSKEEAIIRGEVILSVSPPTASEAKKLEKKHLFVSFLKLYLIDREALKVMIDNKITAVGMEDIEDEDGFRPILYPASEICGKMSVLVAGQFLQTHPKEKVGRGVLLGGLTGVQPAHFVIIGAGTFGLNAAGMALSVGAQVTLFDRDMKKLRDADEHFSGRAATLLGSDFNYRRTLSFADCVIVGVLIPGLTRAPIVLTRDLVKLMRPGSLIIDGSINQGGGVETSQPTNIHDPIFLEEGIVHYCVPNIGALVSRSASCALTNVLTPYIHKIAHWGVKEALSGNKSLAKGVYMVNGKFHEKRYADYFRL